MSMADKSVDTDELCYPLVHNTFLEVARLEAVLNTLVENKAESIKNYDRLAGIQASPRALARRIKLATSKEKKEHDKRAYRAHKKKYRRKHRDEEDSIRGIKSRRSRGKSKQRVSSSSPESARFNLGKGCERTPPLSEDDAFLQYDPAGTSCCCGDDIVEVRINPGAQYDDEFVSLKIEEDFDEEDEEEARRRDRRKRRRRRRKRRRLKAMSIAVVEEVKVLDPDELPQRARWTIVATACLLLFMCLMLVGVTLRMAPLIDDMVRKENEELMNSLHRFSSHNSSPPTPGF